eukprot:CAMPEP_0206372004 /NCGR_PEP_ID=MMETSP0294-20121207/6841_1 /ASSEMBLY_ACC=CAM_ASM_000327 /TAXON_ID=39354 /ORGANISM="Heterosigma akashiwo, Strain CCMP2393" /LENGTH=64 /DNA_ID=CAMNT_0053819281 /DNA_START=241 /DNA_END=432 /DNA_ORIENTATION=-
MSCCSRGTTMNSIITSPLPLRHRPQAVTVEEAPSQSATFRRRVPASAEELAGVLPGAMAAVAAR